MGRFPFYPQTLQSDCGPACLKMVSKYYGRFYELSHLRKAANTYKEGTSLKELIVAAETVGFKTLPVRMSVDRLDDIDLPAILFVDNSHFVVLYKSRSGEFLVADPREGKLSLSREELVKRWIPTGGTEGVCLILETTDDFYQKQEVKEQSTAKYKLLFSYGSRHKSYAITILAGLLITGGLNIAFPFLTQLIVDVGIRSKDLNFIFLILMGQIALFLGKALIESVRNWVLLYVCARIYIETLSGFLIKLMKLPYSFFESLHIGDVLSRINDHDKVENFLAGFAINILYSATVFICFGVVLYIYDISIFLIFLAGSTIYFVYASSFLRRKRLINQALFNVRAEQQSYLINTLGGIHEVKLNSLQNDKHKEWLEIQRKLFQKNLQNTKVDQLNGVGGTFINELKNITITAFAASAVLNGDITLGMMLGIQFIVGQLNVPLNNFILFANEFQTFKMSLERISEIYQLRDEDDEFAELNSAGSPADLDMTNDLTFDNVHFKYPTSARPVFDKLSLTIPAGKVTAIVGKSGSGKTTLLKLITKLHNPSEGNICLGPVALNTVKHDLWREQVGVVMQETFLFEDTIRKNITLRPGNSDTERLKIACRRANILEFIETLPLGFETKIGWDGIDLSQGQKQRIALARALFKEPKLLMLDEATSALDTENERVVMANLRSLSGGTFVIIAHRLSTVRSADQILVLDEGKIVETGKHDELIKAKGYYYTLIQNQLELN